MTALTALLFPSIAYADGEAIATQPGWYGQLSGYSVDMLSHDLTFSGVGSTRVTAGTGYGVSAAAGYRIVPALRVEGEFSYRQSQVEALGIHGTYNSRAAMANIYSDFGRFGKVVPYVGAGAGVADVDDSDDPVAADQLMAGVSYNADDKTAFVLGYRYFATQTPEDTKSLPGITVKEPYRTHNIELGIRRALN